MTKLLKKSISLLIYLLVLVAGSSIIFMLIVEHQQSKELIKNNQFLMKNTVIKTLTNSIYDRLSDYPSSADEIENDWKKLPLNFHAMQKGKWIYPYRFEGKQSELLSPLWQSYLLSANKTDNLTNNSTNTLKIETQQRLTALSTIREALKNNHPELGQHIENYFSLVENYRLSPLEEVISGLSFLQLGTDSRWNNELIQLYLFKGSRQLTSLSEYIFKQNKTFTVADIKLSITEIRKLLEDSNIYSGWFSQSALQLWKHSPDINGSNIQNYSLVENQWISVQLSSGLVLLLPFSIEEELVLVKNTLESQGILNTEDTISLDNNQMMVTTRTIENIPYQINRNVWKQQIKQQQYFFMVKVILTLIFIAALISLVAFITFRNRKKLEFLQLRENFINLVSHELKTPLASMRIMLETLQKRDLKNLSIKDYPQRIISEVDRLWLMVDNLLSMNQIKSGELELNIDKVNLTTLINHVFEKFKEQHSDKLEFDNKLTDICICLIDPVLFELVLINLFSNAIKYNNNTVVKIKVSLDEQNNKILFADNGCGIEADNWQQVFSQFYRETSSNSKPGTGIGLALCRQIMKLHKGEIEIQKSDENGTLWVFDRPQ